MACSRETIKVTWELQKIFGLDDDVKVSCTAVRVPTLRAHSETIVVETEEPISPDDVRKLLESSEGVKVVDDPESLKYPMPLSPCCFEVQFSIFISLSMGRSVGNVWNDIESVKK